MGFFERLGLGVFLLSTFWGGQSQAFAQSGCPKFSTFHSLLPEVDRQLASSSKLATTKGPLKPGKIGYGFNLKTSPIKGFRCKANTLYYDRKTVVNCFQETSSKSQSQQKYDYYFSCLIDQGWGQRSIYFVDPSNDRTELKLYSLEDSFSIEFVQQK